MRLGLKFGTNPDAPEGNRGYVAHAVMTSDIFEILPDFETLPPKSGKYQFHGKEYLIDDSDKVRVVFKAMKIESIEAAKKIAAGYHNSENGVIFCSIGNTGKGMLVGAAKGTLKTTKTRASRRAVRAMDWLRKQKQ